MNRKEFSAALQRHLREHPIVQIPSRIRPPSNRTERVAALLFWGVLVFWLVVIVVWGIVPRLT